MRVEYLQCLHTLGCQYFTRKKMEKSIDNWVQYDFGRENDYSQTLIKQARLGPAVFARYWRHSLLAKEVV